MPFEDINQKTRLFGVIGYPLGHTLSPAMHNTAFSIMDINAVYLAFPVEDLAMCVNAIRTLKIGGLSVTIPHKTNIIPMLDEVDDLARKIRAVNTVVNNDGRLTGHNTDAIGAFMALEEKTELAGKSCAIIGAGGAARAIGYILKEKNIEVTIINRSIGRGKTLADDLSCPFIPLNKFDDTGADILINTTSVGMSPYTDHCPVPEHILKKGMVVMDIIYNPLETKLLAIAKNKGCIPVSGLGMFVYQGAEQLRLWTGENPPVDEMEKAVSDALGI
jgi:shikimate dehydrogenase